MNKYALLAIVFLVGVPADLLTKTWAENNLASEWRTYTHAMYRTIGEEHAGLTFPEWVESALGHALDSPNGMRVLYSTELVVGRDGESVQTAFLPHDRPLEVGMELEIRQRQIEVIPGHWNFVYVRNPGAAWGIFGNQPESFRRPFFFTVSILALGLVLWLFHGTHPVQRRLIWALSLIVAGAVGNFIDRIRYGYVVDFVDWYVTIGGTERHWPTFNVADAFISIGFVLLVTEIFKPSAPPVEEGPHPGTSEEAPLPPEPSSPTHPSHGA